jgi:hypothetical protein
MAVISRPWPPDASYDVERFGAVNVGNPNMPIFCCDRQFNYKSKRVLKNK